MYSGERADNPNYWKPYVWHHDTSFDSQLDSWSEQEKWDIIEADSDLQITGGPGGGRGEGLQKKFSRPFRPQFGLKNKGNKGGGGLGAPGPIPWIRHCINTDIHISLSIVCDIQLARKIKLTCLFIFCLGVTFVCIIVISRQYLISLFTSRDHLISFSVTQNPINLIVFSLVLTFHFHFLITKSYFFSFFKLTEVYS